MARITRTLALTTCGIAISLFTSVIQAADTRVNCHQPGVKGTIAYALKWLNPADTNVVRVSGHCVENLVIRGFNRLSILAEQGALIEGVSGVDLPVIEISDSLRVVVQGFIIRGGTTGLHCSRSSSCRFIGDTVEDTKAGAVNYNAAISIDGSDVELTDIVVRNVVDLGIALYGAKAVANNVSVNGVTNVNSFTGGAGLFMTAGSLRNGPIKIQNTDAAGLSAFHGSALDISQLTVTDNGGVGVWIGDGSVLNVGVLTVERSKVFGLLFQTGSAGNFYGTGSLIDSNRYDGIVVQGGSSVGIGGVTVSNNPVFGLFVDDVSVVYFYGPSNFMQNSYDIWCNPPTATVQNLGNATNTTTNCGTTSPLAPANALTVPKVPGLPHN